MNNNNGGPAFPSKGKINRPRSQIYPNATGSEVIDVVNTGMTLRDYFAAKAMQGLLAGTLSPTILWSQQEMAGLSYQMADAMLKAREE